MKKCEKCGEMIKNEAKFCPSCGTVCEDTKPAAAKATATKVTVTKVEAAKAQPAQGQAAQGQAAPKPQPKPVVKRKIEHPKAEVTSCGYSIMGIIALIASLSFSAIVGLVLGIIDYKSDNGCPKGMAIAAIVISGVRILAVIIGMCFGASFLSSLLSNFNSYGNGYQNGLNNGFNNFNNYGF